MPKKQQMSNLDRQEILADNQMQLLELLSKTLVFEESHLLGFLPLRSYFLTKKSQEMQGKKCPLDKEDIVRSLIFKD